MNADTAAEEADLRRRLCTLFRRTGEQRFLSAAALLRDGFPLLDDVHIDALTGPVRRRAKGRPTIYDAGRLCAMLDVLAGQPDLSPTEVARAVLGVAAENTSKAAVVARLVRKLGDLPTRTRVAAVLTETSAALRQAGFAENAERLNCAARKLNNSIEVPVDGFVVGDHQN